MRNLLTKAIIQRTIALCSLLMCIETCVAETEPEKTPNPNGANKELVNIQEVDFGKNAVLLCHSNDVHHFFLFWQLADDAVVGPGNTFDERKYGYEILTGNLIIRVVSDQQEGIYHCVSRGVTDNNINIRSVRMIVKKDWDEVDAHDPGVNYFRGVVVVASLLVIAGAIYFGYRLKKRHRLQSLLEEDDEEDSAEEIFRQPGTSKATTSKIVLQKEDDDPVEIPKISIDFEDILTNSHK